MNQIKQLMATLLLICLVTLTYAQGESCATAVAITAGVHSADGPSTGGMSNDAEAINADWYTFTSDVSGFLSINACGGGADTRLWIHSGACGELILEADNDDFCDRGDGQELASNIENFVALAGVTYYIEWDDRWYEAEESTLTHPAFEFTVGFIAAPNSHDGAVTRSMPFYQIPVTQISSSGLAFTATVANLGYDQATNVTLTVDVEDEAGISVFNETSAPTNLAAVSEVEIVAGIFDIPMGSYNVCFNTSIAEPDGDGSNNVLCRPLVVSQVTYGNDNPAGIQSGLGIDNGTVSQGQSFFMYNADVLTSISGFIRGGNAGDNLQWQIYELDPDTGPGAVVYDSGPTTLATASPGWLHHTLNTPLPVNAGQTYVVSLFHAATGQNIALGTSTDIFTPGVGWISINGNPWQNPENVGAGFPVTYLLRPNFGGGSFACTSTVDMSAEVVDPAGVSVAYWNAAAAMVTTPCIDNGDGTWNCTFTANALDSGGYLYVNGTTNEVGPMNCGVDPGVGFNYRPVQLEFADIVKGSVCFSRCGSCPSGECTGPNELLCEDLEIYDATLPLGPQSPGWTTWTGAEGGGEDASLSTAQAASGNNSVSLVGGGAQDVLLLLGNLTSGRYRTTMKMYVPAGNTAYYNIQHFEAPGLEWAQELFFEADGLGSLAAENVMTAFTYPLGEWFTIDQIIDIDNDWTTLMIDGVEIYAWPFSAQSLEATGTNQLGAYNFFPRNANDVYFVDDIFLEQLPTCGLDAATIICDDFEFYTAGSMIGPQSSFWTTRTGTEGGAEDGLSSSDFAASGTNSMLIAEDQTQDVILLLGNRSAGFYDLTFQMYVPAGSTGYYNLQGNETVDVSSPIEVFLNANGAGLVRNSDMDGATFTYPHDTWFEVKHRIDLYNDVMQLTINGAVVEAAWPYPDLLGGVDFFANGNANRYHIDDVTLKELPTQEAGIAITFQVNMNPIIDANALSPNGVHIVGDFNEFNPTTSEMLDADGDGIYTFTQVVNEGAVPQFLFVNGNTLADQENDITGDCGVDNNNDGTFNRFWVVGSADEETTAFCFNECNANCSIDVDEVTFQSSLSMFPNPTSGNTTLYYNFPESLTLDISMTNNVGQVVYNNVINNAISGNVEINVDNLVSGVYFVMLSDGENLVSKKLFVE